MAEATYRVLYQEDGLLGEDRRGDEFCSVTLERWEKGSTTRWIVTAGRRELRQWGDWWKEDPAVILLDVTTDAEAIRYAIKAYDVLKAETHVTSKK